MGGGVDAVSKKRLMWKYWDGGGEVGMKLKQMPWEQGQNCYGNNKKIMEKSIFL